MIAAIPKPPLGTRQSSPTRRLTQARNNAVRASVNSNLHETLKQAAPGRSTTDYLRNAIQENFLGQPKRARSATNVGRDQHEDLKEELLHYKRSVLALTNETALLKAKLKKVESGSTKKTKEIEDLLGVPDTSATEATLLGMPIPKSKSNDSAMVTTLKQKIFRLEQALKDREESLSKLKSDMKITRIEETKAQLETFYQEILRLQYSVSKASGEPALNENLPKELAQRMKTMNDRILKLTTEKKELEKQLSGVGGARKVSTSGAKTMKEYEKYSKAELLDVIANLTENQFTDDDAIRSKSKIDALTKERDQLRELVSKLKMEKQQYRAQLEIKGKADSRKKEDSSDPRLQRLPKPHASVSTKLRRSSSTKDQVVRKPSLDKRRGSVTLSTRDKLKLNDIRQNIAARTIQRAWRDHQENDAASVIAATTKGHLVRKQHLSRHATHSDDDSPVDDSGIEEAIVKIQSAGRAHLERKNYLTANQRRHTADSDDDSIRS